MHINVARLLVSRVKLNIINTRNLVLRLRFFQIFLCQRFRLMVHFNVYCKRYDCFWVKVSIMNLPYIWIRIMNLSHSLSSKRGDRMTYISGLENLLEIKKQHPEYQMILHSDQGSVYASKAYNDLLPYVCGKIHVQSWNTY